MAEYKSEIVNPALFIDALKSSGYKSTYNAIAEIVDNSIDADAKDIFILGKEDVSNGERRIKTFAFLDNGNGMNAETLAKCLCVGYHESNNSYTPRGKMGRFGVGLPQASIFVCDRVEVYSWQNGIENCQKVYLDVQETKEKNLNLLAAPTKSNIPAEYKKYIYWQSEEKKFDFSVHGTLVVWSKCTKIDHKKWKTCVNHMSMDLGRKYRYFLADESKTISMIEMTGFQYKKLLPNDPLYLMSPSQECMPDDVKKLIANNYQSTEYNKLTGFTEPMFTIYKVDDQSADVQKLNIKYEQNDEIKEGVVTIKYSVVKEKYYSAISLETDTKPGALPFGQSHRLTNNIGISIVRNNREIDFDSFKFFDNYNVPDYRWWGIEVSFSEDMDDAFGISNNKQYVDLKALSKQEIADLSPEERAVNVWYQLADSIRTTITSMKNRNSKIREEKIGEATAKPNEASQIATESDKKNKNEIQIPVLSEEEQIKEAKKQLQLENEQQPTEEQIKQFINSGVRVKLVHNKSPRDSFIDYVPIAGVLSIYLNAQHPFYEKFVKEIWEDEYKKVPFELFIIAVMKSIKNQEQVDPNLISELVYDINKRLTGYITEYKRNNE